MTKKTRKAKAARECYVILETQKDEHGYIPSLVTENEPGYAPMIGKDETATPWYWGKTRQRANEVCARYNKNVFGITQATADRIVASSMLAANME